MLEVLSVILFCWLSVKVLSLAFRMAWGVARIAGMLLFVLAVPLLVLSLLLAGGFFLLLPLALVGAAFGLLRGCA